MKTNIVLPSGTKVSISARFVEFDKPKWDERGDWHPHFRITIRTDRTGIHQLLKPARYTFDYWGSVMDYRENKQELSEKELVDTACCFMSDAAAYDCSRGFVDFCECFGYEKIEDFPYAKRAYNGCKRAHAAAQRLFGEFYGEDHAQLEEYANKLFNQ